MEITDETELIEEEGYKWHRITDRQDEATIKEATTKNALFQAVIVEIYDETSIEQSVEQPTSLQKRVLTAFREREIPFQYWGEFLTSITQSENLPRLDSEIGQRRAFMKKAVIESEKLRKESKYLAAWAVLIGTLLGSLLVAVATVWSFLHEATLS
jgi:hypothetical protein